MIERLTNEQLIEMLNDVEHEKEILIETLGNHNEMIRRLKEMELEYSLLAEHNKNLLDAIFIILSTIDNLNGVINPNEISDLLSIVSTVAMNSYLNNSMEDEFATNIERGKRIAENISKKINSDEEKVFISIQVFEE